MNFSLCKGCWFLVTSTLDENTIVLKCDKIANIVWSHLSFFFFDSIQFYYFKWYQILVSSELTQFNTICPDLS